jgi:hypothetical protein
MRAVSLSNSPEAILISGVYGIGKSTMCGQIADLLDEPRVHYAALDLDWLVWAWPGVDEDDHGPASEQMLLENLALVVGNYRRRGNDRFILAGAVMTDREWRAIRDTLAMPARLVWLTASIETIRERLALGPDTGRLDDARQTEAWLAGPLDDPPTPDLEIANDGPLLETAREILAWTGWLERGEGTAAG